MKYENLIKARENGFEVPEFQVIRFEEVFFGEKELGTALESADFSDIPALSDRLMKIIGDNTRFEGEVLLDAESYAVRSSSSTEDGKNVSFAGQFETFLDVSRGDVPEKVKECVMSLFCESALRCALENNTDIASMKMNVIVQRMLHPQLSGVLFTANPQGILNESVITVGRGRGDGVVSDRTKTTSYYYSLADRAYYYEGEEDLLSAEKTEELIELSILIKEVFESELLDIEFAIENEKIYILQVREITTLNADNPTVLDNSNIVESYPGISLPLTDSFVKIVYAGVFRGLAERVLKSKKITDKYSSAFANMVGSANGRMYYKISNWYTVIKFLPLSSKIIPVWQEMLGVKVKSYDSEKVDISALARVRTYINSVYEFLSVQRNMKKLEREFNSVNESYYEKIDSGLSEGELVALFDDIRDRLLKVWDVTLLNDMYSFVFTGLVKSRLKKTNPNDYEKISANFLSGISNIESMKPVRALAELAQLSLEGKDSEEYKGKYQSYISLYGDRYLEELKLESRTFRTDNTLLDKKIDEYAADCDRLTRLLSAEDISQKQIKGRGILFPIFVKKAVLGIKSREVSRLNRSRVFGMVRGIFLRLAKSFEERGVIDKTEDIFYLTVEEVFSLVRENENVKDRIKRRKREYEMYKLLPAYSRLIFSGKEFNKSHAGINSSTQVIDGNELRGTPCSNGIAEGEVLIVKDVNAVGDVKGKILVTKMTDPGWVFLLAGASGIIAEKGSLLSHTAIVSREIGIPSIVGAENALRILKNGDRVRMDGASGVIEIVG